MKYFLPEILIRGQSDDISDVVKSDKEWDEASEDYQKDLECVLHRAPASVKRLASLDLHDAVVCEMPKRWPFDEAPRFSHVVNHPVLFWMESRGKGLYPSGDVFIAVKSSEGLTVLIYKDANFEERGEPAGWNLHSNPTVWLYDELRADEGTPNWLYTHEILFSTGKSYTIWFADVWILEMKVP